MAVSAKKVAELLSVDDELLSPSRTTEDELRGREATGLETYRTAA